jgi:protein subunit release factor A
MMTKILSLGGRLRMAAACPDANAPLLAEAADAIEQHEAFKQEVSDIVDAHVNATNETMNDAWEKLKTLIIPKPKPKSDPLVEVIAGWTGGTVLLASDLRAALEARGLEIRKKDE